MTDADGSASAEPQPFPIAIDDVRPSQLYVDGLKLSLVTQWFDFADPNYDALPVRKVEDEWMLTDGHTRAFVTYLAGADRLRIVRDTDDLPMDVYRTCLDWCEEEGVTEIGDLTGRVLNHDDFEEQWIARCQAEMEDG
ncbi:hypothetical protein [Halorussus litoreus]|uniref:hypothetical protein n=1 Tax=Halorussus litoreus TaxID=1710536 RepID=UPI0018E58EB2|nr:hypothetical protein [Halorussus litoreus]